MGAGQQANLAGEGANLVESTTIAALLAVEDRNAEGFFLQVVERLGDLEFRSGREFFEHGFFDFLAECADGFRAVHFAAGVERGLDAVAGDRVGDFRNGGVHLEEGHRAFRLADGGGEIALGGDEELYGLAGEIETGVEVGLGEFLGRAFDHDDFFSIADIDEVEVAVGAFVMRGVDDELAVDAADAHGADGSGERNVGNAERGRGTVDRKDVRVVLAIGAQEERNDLRVVEIALRKERAQGTIGHARGEDFLFGGTALALEISAGEFANGGCFFFVFDGEREEVLAFFDGGGRDGGDDDDGVAAANGYGAVGEFREFAGFKNDGSIACVGSGCMGHGMYDR